MYLIKTTTPPPETQKTINLNAYVSAFSFFPFLHYDKHEMFKQSVGDNLVQYADIAASVVARLFATRANDDVVIQGLHACRDILLSKGFRETTPTDLYGDLTVPQRNAHVVLVAGCQDDLVLESRVDAAINLIRRIPTDVDLVFAGSSPVRPSVRIPNESIRMSNIFEDRVRNGALSQQERAGIKSVKRFLENQSKTTQENISNFFGSDYLNPRRQNCLYLVSSTFHLLRLTKDCESYMSSNAYKGNIAELILCGADDINRPSGTARSGNYIKLMFFDIFHHLLQTDEFCEQHPPG